MKKFVINCDFGGQIAPFNIYIGSPEGSHHPLQFQADWLSKQRGGNIPTEVMDSIAKLKVLAEKNNVSLEELCVYALGSAQQDENTSDENEVGLDEMQTSTEESLSQSTENLAENNEIYKEITIPEIEQNVLLENDFVNQVDNINISSPEDSEPELKDDKVSDVNSAYSDQNENIESEVIDIESKADDNDTQLLEEDSSKEINDLAKNNENSEVKVTDEINYNIEDENESINRIDNIEHNNTEDFESLIENKSPSNLNSAINEQEYMDIKDEVSAQEHNSEVNNNQSLNTYQNDASTLDVLKNDKNLDEVVVNKDLLLVEDKDNQGPAKIIMARKIKPKKN